MLQVGYVICNPAGEPISETLRVLALAEYRKRPYTCKVTAIHAFHHCMAGGEFYKTALDSPLQVWRNAEAAGYTLHKVRTSLLIGEKEIV